MFSRRFPLHLLFLAILLSTSCCSNTAYYTGVEGHAGPVAVSATVNSQGKLVFGGSFSQTLVGTDFLGIDWIAGFETTLLESEGKQNYLFIIWEDEFGDVWRDQYRIGEPFTVEFGREHWVRKIEQDDNGNVVVAVEIKGIATGGSSPREVTVSKPTFQDLESLPNLWNLAGYRDLNVPNNPDTESYYVTVRSTDKWRWGFSWHAIDSSTLQEILKPFSVEFFVNGEKLSNAQILTYNDTDPNGWVCKRWATMLSNWPPNGRIELEVRYRLTESIHDGKEIFAPGLYRQVIIVSVR